MSQAMIVWTLLIAAMWLGFYITYDYSDLTSLIVMGVSGVIVMICYTKTRRKAWCVFMAVSVYAAIAGNPLFGTMAAVSTIIGYIFIKEARGYFLEWWRNGFEGLWECSMDSLLKETEEHHV